MAKKLLGWTWFIFFIAAAAPLAAQFRVIHSFAGGAADGANPIDSLIIKDSTLYGMTTKGGAGREGTIFKVMVDGTGFSLLHSFGLNSEDGRTPVGSLMLDGSTLYGMAAGGGSIMDSGTLFKLDLSTGSYITLHVFSGGPRDGANPLGTLIKVGEWLYGLTFHGGAGPLVSGGTIFRIRTDGTRFALLHSFAEGSGDGLYPMGSLVSAGTVLYGTTGEGGTANCGTIFRINIDGTGFGLLHSFRGSPTDGKFPKGSLVARGATLYGTTEQGGAFDKGTVFRIGMDGTGFGSLHSFRDVPGDGDGPSRSLTLDGTMLYGTTALDTCNGCPCRGTIFKIGTNGSGFTLIHVFCGVPCNGSRPIGSLLLATAPQQEPPHLGKKALFGMTHDGGSKNLGVIFGLVVD